MKNLLFNIFLLFSLSITITFNAQTIVNMAGDNSVLPPNYRKTGEYYIKDLSNYLNSFTGTWEYTNGNESFQIILDKKIKYHVVIPQLNLDYYKDGITIQYKKFINSNLIYASPVSDRPTFQAEINNLLSGYVTDYGRIAKTVVVPKINKVLLPGGYPLQPNCDIELIPTNANEPKKIKFHLYYWDHLTNYDHETYAGQSIFSVPNDIIMTKVE